MRIYIKATGCKMSLKNADLVVYDNSIIINNRHTEIELIFKDIQIQSKSPIHKNYICFDDEGKEVNIYCRM